MEQLVDSESPIPPEVTRILGITNAMVRGKPTVGNVLPKFLDFPGGPETILLAHNASFDLDFLGIAAAKLGIPLPAHCVVETLYLARTCLRGVANHRLETVAVHLGDAAREDHRSLSDSRLIMGVFEEILGCKPGLRTLGDLFRLTSPPGSSARQCLCRQATRT
jgi:DNA polymerase-3 subunit epsilon